jgi:hypothetical protein
MLMSKTKGQNSVLTWLFNGPRDFISRAAWRWGKVHQYEEKDGMITLHNGLFSSHSVHVGDIKSWAVYPEMGFDVVRIELFTNEGLTWLDKYNDLLTILRKLIPSKEVPKTE